MAKINTRHQLANNSRELRSNPTEAETILWLELQADRLANAHFRRQHVVGPYIVDFCATRQKLIIEVDGGQHIEQEEYDKERSAFLESKGYRVLRFWNHEVLNHLDGVILAILDTLKITR